MVGELVNGEICEYEIYLEDFGLFMFVSCNLQVGNVIEFKEKIFEVLCGEFGLVYDIVVINVVIVFYVVGVVFLIVEGLQMVCVIIVFGVVCVKLDQFVQVICQFGGKY